MRRTLTIMVGVISFGVQVPVMAAPPVWQNLETTPAASLGRPVAARLGQPRPVEARQPSLNQPIIRSAAPDPLVGDYSPAARFGPASEIRPVGSGTSSSLDPIDPPEERYNWGIPNHLATNRSKADVSHSTDKFGEKFHGGWRARKGVASGQIPAIRQGSAVRQTNLMMRATTRQ